MDSRKCGTCCFCGSVAVPAGPPAEEGGMPAMRSVDVCRFNPPSAVIVNIPDRGPQAITVWPQVDVDNDYCGKYSKGAESCDALSVKP